MVSANNPHFWASLPAEALAKPHTVAGKVEQQLTKQDSLVKDVAIPIFSAMKQAASAVQFAAQFIATSLVAIGVSCAVAVDNIAHVILSTIRPQDLSKEEKEAVKQIKSGVMEIGKDIKGKAKDTSEEAYKATENLLPESLRKQMSEEISKGLPVKRMTQEEAINPPKLSEEEKKLNKIVQDLKAQGSIATETNKTS